MIELSLTTIYFGTAVILSLSAGMIYFAFRCSKAERNLARNADRPESIELQEFMMDLLSGGGLIHVKRIAPADIVMRTRRTK